MKQRHNNLIHPVTLSHLAGPELSNHTFLCGVAATYNIDDAATKIIMLCSLAELGLRLSLAILIIQIVYTNIVPAMAKNLEEISKSVMIWHTILSWRPVFWFYQENCWCMIEFLKGLAHFLITFWYVKHLLLNNFDFLCFAKKNLF